VYALLAIDFLEKVISSFLKTPTYKMSLFDSDGHFKIHIFEILPVRRERLETRSAKL